MSSSLDGLSQKSADKFPYQNCADFKPIGDSVAGKVFASEIDQMGVLVIVQSKHGTAMSHIPDGKIVEITNKLDKKGVGHREYRVAAQKRPSIKKIK